MMILNSIEIQTKLGPMIAIADDSGIYLLQFTDKPNLQQEIANLCAVTKAHLSSNSSSILCTLANELTSYFDGTLTNFTVPLKFMGTPFQKKSWQILEKISYGTTQSYAQQAITAGNHKAYRAVARANSQNHIAIVIPCHRIIQSNGMLGGYAGGISKKEWLIAHEKNSRNTQEHLIYEARK